MYSQQENRVRPRCFHFKSNALLCVFIQRASLLHSVDLNTTRNEKSLNLTSIVVFFTSPRKTDYSVSTQLSNVSNSKVLLAISQTVNSLAFLQLKYKTEIA